MLSKARGCNALATSLEMQQIRDAPLVMHQDHSESLGLHVAQRINCYKLPRKLPQIRSAQQLWDLRVGKAPVAWVAILLRT